MGMASRELWFAKGGGERDITKKYVPQTTVGGRIKETGGERTRW